MSLSGIFFGAALKTAENVTAQVLIPLEFWRIVGLRHLTTPKGCQKCLE
jgi:hypothetical protein